MKSLASRAPSLLWPATPLVLATLTLATACREVPGPETGGRPEALALLAQPQAGFVRPQGTWEVRLPADYAAHEAFRSEVWAIKGTLVAPPASTDKARGAATGTATAARAESSGESGGQERDRRERGAQEGKGSGLETPARRFGFELVFLRLALAPTPPARRSAWAAHQVYLAYFALTDAAEGSHQVEERIGRAALGLAGSARDPARVWLEDWHLEAGPDGRLGIRAATTEASLDLRLVPVKPVLGQDRIDLPPLTADAPFHFFVVPRLAAEGTLVFEGDGEGGGQRQRLAVTGTAWLERAFGDVPTPQGRGQTAVDRFALQLEDGRDLLCLRLHRRDGSGTPIPSCLAIAADGSTRDYGRRDLRLEPEGDWISPRTGTRYPVRWRLSVPELELTLALAPLVEDQERTGVLRAYSGAVEVAGRGRDGEVSGQGFLELGGYARDPAGGEPD